MEIFLILKKFVKMKLLIMGSMFIFNINSRAGASSSETQITPQIPFIVIEKNDNLYNKKNHLQIINHGAAAFAKRLKMIEEAKSSIEVEYFIYNTDASGKLFTQELIKKALQGVKVRILVDASSVIFQLNEVFANELRNYGIEVRYFNTSYFLSSSAIRYRNHRKLFIVDGKEAILGGRNIADEYFDLSTTFNFADRDIYVNGPIVLNMRRSFDGFWNSNIVKKPDYSLLKASSSNGFQKFLGNDISAERAKAKWFFNFNDKDSQNLKEKVLNIGLEELNHSAQGTCEKLIFVSDTLEVDAGRLVWQVVSSELNQVKKSLLIESPYFILQESGNQLLHSLLQKNVKVSGLTNSLNSTDAFYTIPFVSERIPELVQSGLDISTFIGIPLFNYKLIGPEIKSARWGVHAKSAVYDDNNFIIGTFNVDPRSKNLNKELALICKNGPELAHSLKENIEWRIKHAVKLNADGVPTDNRGELYGAALLKKINYYLSQPIVGLFEDLL